MWFFDLLTAAVYALLLQNLVFTGGFGISEVVRISTKSGDYVYIAFLLTFFSTATAAICRGLDAIGAIRSLSTMWHVIIYCMVLAVVYLATAGIISFTAKSAADRLHRIGMAAMNTLVLAVPLINRRSAFTFAESIGSGIGAGLAFVLAVLMVEAGMNRISDNSEIPGDFKGRPALFIYVAMISLALAGFTGTSLFV